MSVPQLEAVVSTELQILVPNSLPSGEPGHCRATIIARLARVLRDSEAHVTNIESVIGKIGVSLHEISVRFGGTRELILAMTSELTERMAAPLAVSSMRAELRERLLEFGEHVLELCATSHWRALYRIVVTEAIRQTGLPRDFHEVGPGRLMQHLAGFLRIAQEEGTLASGDPHLLASLFLTPLLATLDNERLTPELAISAVIRSAYVRGLVELFCHGVRRARELC